MGNYTPYYENGWKTATSGGTPITADALNNMEGGIKAALRTDKVIAIYGQPINFTNGVGYFYDTRIHAGAAVPFVQEIAILAPSQEANISSNSIPLLPVQ